jgi:hypothetical protein
MTGYRTTASRLHPNGSGDVAEPSPEAATLEYVEVEVFVESRRLFVDGVDHHRSGSELATTSYAAAECVDEQMASELLALLRPGDGQPGEQHHGHGIRHAPAEARRSVLMGDRGHGQGVVADDATTPAKHVRRCGAGRRRDTGGSFQPPVEFGHPAIELVHRLVFSQQFNRPQRLGRHCVGIGLRFLA